MKNNLIYSCILAFTFFISCEEKVDPSELKLKDGTERIVIEGNIEYFKDEDSQTVNDSGPFIFQITKTTPYFSNTQPNKPNYLSGAVVELSDNTGQYEKLTEFAPGLHSSSTIKAIPGNIYTLKVSAENKTYTATAKMEVYVPVSSLSYEYKENETFFDDGYYVTFKAYDPLGIGNHYRVKGYANNSLFNKPEDYVFSDDLLADGNEIIFECPFVFKANETASIEIVSIAEKENDYLETLIQQLNAGSSPFSVPPANLITNLDNGALGYFGVHSTSRRSLLLP